MKRRVTVSPTEYVFKHAPRDPVVRIGARDTDLWQPKGWDHPRRHDDGTFGYRFDDPGRLHNPPIPDNEMFRMLYCASELVGAACEVAAFLRPSTDELAKRSGQPQKGVMDEDWCRGLAAGYTTVDEELLFVDLAASATASALSEAQNIAHWAAEADYRDFHPIMFQGPNRRLTQEVARHIFEQTQPGAPGLPGQPAGTIVAGIYYRSRHGDEDYEYPCWAMYDVRIMGKHHPLANKDLSLRDGYLLAADLKRAAQHLGLVVEAP